MGEKYDIVIVGSGLGGLVCGAILAKQGKTICVLEKQHQIGGNLQVFSRKGCSFSAGMHYAGSLSKGQILYKVFSYLDIYNKLDIKHLDQKCFEKIYIGEKEYSYAAGMENFKQNLIHFFPNEKEAIETYARKLEEIWDASDLLNLRDVNQNEMQQFLEYEENAYDYIESLTKNEDLKAVLASTNGLYIGNKKTTPLYIHANINKFFINSAWRIGDKGSTIASLLSEIIENNGGKVVTRTEVTNLNFDGANIQSAQTKNGDRFFGSHFISNIHPLATLNLIEPGKVRKAYSHRIQNATNSISAFTLYIVLKKREFKHINSNIYYSKNKNVWDSANYSTETWPQGYMMYTTEDELNIGYAESIVVISMMHFDDVRKWENTWVEKRGDDYKKFKTEKSEILLNLISIKFPDLKNAVDECFSASPLTYRDYTHTFEGSMYGIVKDCNNPLGTFISPFTKIPNLLLTGQNLSLHGMLGVIMTAFQTCAGLININKLLAEIRNQ